MTFTVDQNGLDVGETVQVQFDADGNGVFETLLSTINTGSSSTGATTTVTMSGGTANSAIRFVASAITGAGEDVRIDNLSIAYSSAATAVNGNGNANILVGDANGSTFEGAGGNDVVLAGLGNDTIIWNAGDGRDIVDGGAGGTDTFVINGDNSNTNPETYRVYARADALAAGIAGLAANTDIVITRSAGTGAASVVAELDEIEEIVINTGGGDDIVTMIGNFNPTNLNFNTVTVNGGDGNDTVDISGLGSDHRVVFNTGAGTDHVIGVVRPQDVVSHGVNGDSGNPEATPTTPADGDDDNDDTFVGTSANNHCDAGSGNDRVWGLAGNDKLEGGSGNDKLWGGRGNDKLLGGSGNDDLWGGAGHDNLRGGDGNDTIKGGVGNDRMTGGSGNDDLWGGAGHDNLRGGDGNDTIKGGVGNDRMTGGSGNDKFVFNRGFGNDVITDFDANPAGGQDKLDISALGITDANFAMHVLVLDLGADTLISVDGESICLKGVSNSSTVTISDFVLFGG